MNIHDVIIKAPIKEGGLKMVDICCVQCKYELDKKIKWDYKWKVEIDNLKNNEDKNQKSKKSNKL